MKPLAMIIALIFISLLTGGCSNAKTYGPYHGKIVDAETKEPIEGAAVLAVFYANEPGPAGSITRFADTLETLSDKNGEFRIPEHKISPAKWKYFMEPHGYFTIFKPGYGCYPMHRNVKPMFVPNGMLPSKETVTIELPRLKAKEERRTNQSCFPSSVPDNKMTRLIELNNLERKDLGLEPTHTKE
ncbi:MAG: hypothetical protein ACYC69_06705 [Thermodesulfovibrionales bacterium]